MERQHARSLASNHGGLGDGPAAERSSRNAEIHDTGSFANLTEAPMQLHRGPEPAAPPRTPKSLRPDDVVRVLHCRQAEPCQSCTDGEQGGDHGNEPDKTGLWSSCLTALLTYHNIVCRNVTYREQTINRGHSMADWRERLALTAQRNRQEIVKARLSRREMVRLGLLTAGGSLVIKQGLSSRWAWADSPPTQRRCRSSRSCRVFRYNNRSAQTN